ncbi:MAG: sugar phosphate isomerase/epimerase family protein [Anaerolineae bacterium]|jgi:sugar phosphate isomerase/epimerase
MERILLATYQRDITRHYELAQAHRAGLELQVYGYDTDLLDSGWRELVGQHKGLLQDFEGEIAIHGAFYNLSPGSRDGRVAALTRERYMLNLDIAAKLGARTVVFHTDFLPIVRNPVYRPTWTERQVEFWLPMTEEAAAREVVIALENMWEPDPGIIGDVLDQVDSPHLCACLDIGHVYLFSDYVPLETWVERVSDRLVHCHLNNHRGFFDEHLPLDFPGGVIDCKRDVLPLLRALSNQPALVLEMDEIEYLERSLRYLGR